MWLIDKFFGAKKPALDEETVMRRVRNLQLSADHNPKFADQFHDLDQDELRQKVIEDEAGRNKQESDGENAFQRFLGLFSRWRGFSLEQEAKRDWANLTAKKQSEDNAHDAELTFDINSRQRNALVNAQANVRNRGRDSAFVLNPVRSAELAQERQAARMAVEQARNGEVMSRGEAGAKHMQAAEQMNIRSTSTSAIAARAAETAVFGTTAPNASASTAAANTASAAAQNSQQTVKTLQASAAANLAANQSASQTQAVQPAMQATAQTQVQTAGASAPQQAVQAAVPLSPQHVAHTNAQSNPGASTNVQAQPQASMQQQNNSKAAADAKAQDDKNVMERQLRQQEKQQEHPRDERSHRDPGSLAQSSETRPTAERTAERTAEPFRGGTQLQHKSDAVLAAGSTRPSLTAQRTGGLVEPFNGGTQLQRRSESTPATKEIHHLPEVAQNSPNGAAPFGGGPSQLQQKGDPTGAKASTRAMELPDGAHVAAANLKNAMGEGQLSIVNNGFKPAPAIRAPMSGGAGPALPA